MSTASRLWAQSILRRHWRSTVLLALFAGLTGAASITALSFASRAHDVVDRRIEDLAIADGGVDSCPPGVDPAANSAACYTIDAATQRFSGLRSSRHVSSASVIGATVVQASAAGATEEFKTLAGAIMAQSGTVDKVEIISGRMVDDKRPDEVVLGAHMAEILHARVGSPISLSVCAIDPPTQCDRTTQPRVVGIARSESDAIPARQQAPGVSERVGDIQILTSMAWWQEHADGRYFTNTQFRLAPGSSLGEVLRDLTTASPGWAILVSPNDELTSLDGLRHTTQLQGTALLAIAAIIALAGLVFVGQTMSRQIRRELADHPTLAVLGMSSRDTTFVVIMRSLPIVLGAAVVAMVSGLITSALGLPGLAGRVETTHGLQPDWLILVVGATVVGATVALMLIGSGLRCCAATPRRIRRHAIRSINVPLPAAAQAGLALSRDRGTGRVVRTAIAGMAAAIAVFAVVATLIASLGVVVRTPAQYGVSWEYSVGDFLAVGEVPLMTQNIRNDTLVRDATIIAASGPVDMPAVPPFDVISYTPIKGDLEPVIVSGRAPRADDEVAVGPATLAAMGRHVGDTIDGIALSVTNDTADTPATTAEKSATTGPLKIVGTALISDDEATLGPGKGMLVTEALRKRLDPGYTALTVVRVDPTVSPTAAAAQLDDRYGHITVPNPQNDIQNLSLVAEMPWLVAALVALLAITALGHAIITNIRRNQRQIGVLRALGFTRPQVISTVGWQATIVALIAVVIGIPIGLVLGRWGWRMIADQVGLVTTPAVQVWTVVAAAGLLLVFANLIALWPAIRAGRQDVAASLRAE